MQDLNDLYYFVQVVDHGGFAPAGRAIGVPKSKLSRRIQELEKRLDVQLIQRTTRQFSVTEVGQNYYRHCKAMLVEANAAQEAIELTRAEPCGVVRLVCPIALLQARISPMLAAFMMRYPRVDLHLHATNRRVDLVSESMDIALRVRRLPLEDSDLVMRVLGRGPQWLVGGRELLEQFGKIKVPADLTGLPSLGLGLPHHDFEWLLLGMNGARAIVKHKPRLITRDMVTLRAAAMAGVGITQLPEMMVRNAISRNELVRILPDWAPPTETIHAVFVSRRGQLPAVRALIDFLAAQFEALDND